MFTFIFCLLYFVFGAILSIPYCMLAGWETETFPSMVVATPVLIGVWMVTAFFAAIIDIRPTRIYWRNIFRRANPKSSRAPLVIFWTWTVYALLPVILHWGARLLMHLRVGSVARFLEAHRYESLLYVLWGVMLTCGLMMLYGGVADAATRIYTATISRSKSN